MLSVRDQTAAGLWNFRGLIKVPPRPGLARDSARESQPVYGRAGEGSAMAEPNVAQKAPFKVDVVAGKAYFWCACGQSKNQPFCDGSHKGSTFSPMKYDATESKTVFFCGCKHTHGQPFCDGSHKAL